MKKKKNFRHSSNLRNESAMVRLRIALGPAGYGIYFMLCEHIYQSGKPIPAADLDLLAYELHAPLSDLRAVLTSFGLFAETPTGYILADQVEQVSRPATQEPIPSDNPDDLDNPDNPAPFDDQYEVIDGFDSEFSRMTVKQQIKRTMSRRETYEQMLAAVNGDKLRLKQITSALIAAGKPFPALCYLLTAFHTLAA